MKKLNLVSAIQKTTLVGPLTTAVSGGGPTPGTACPYVMASEDVAAFSLSPFDSFSFSSGTATATLDTSLGTHLGNAAAEADYPRLHNPTPGGSHWMTLLPGSGKVAVELELTQLPDTTFTMGLSGITGNALDSNFAEAQARFYSDPGKMQLQTAGVGARLLVGSDNEYPYTPVQGDRISLVVDTDTGQMDLITPVGHEDFGGVPVVDVTDGAGFVFSGSIGGSGVVDSVTKVYTKASDFTVPKPAGVTDTCGNANSLELLTYALNADEATIQGAGITGKLENPTLAQQRGEFTIPDTAPGVGQLVMVRAPAEPNFGLNLNTGKVAMEFEVEVPDFTPAGAGTGNNQAVLSVGGEIISATTFSRQFAAGFVLSEEGDKFFAITADNGGTTGLVSVTGTKFRVGLLFDNDTNVWRAWVDGVERSLDDNTLPSGSTAGVTPLVTVRTSATDDNGSAGEVVAARFICDSYWFTSPFPAGSRTIDGTVFN